MNLHWLYLTIPLAWFWQNFVHELSHLIVGSVVEGRSPQRMWLWPHKKDGRWRFAGYQSGPATKKGSSRKRHFAPVVGGNIQLVLSVVVGGVVGDGKIDMVILPFVIAPIVDIAVWIYGYWWGSEASDGQRYKKEIQGRSERA